MRHQVMSKGRTRQDGNGQSNEVLEARLDRRNLLFSGSMLAAASATGSTARTQQDQPAAPTTGVDRSPTMLRGVKAADDCAHVATSHRGERARIRANAVSTCAKPALDFAVDENRIHLTPKML
jgi:hypothetical protein